MADCPKCGRELAAGTVFCENCGARLQEGVKRRKVRSRLGSLASAQHKKHIRSARIAIMVTAVLMFIGCAVVWSRTQEEVRKLRSNPNIIIDEQKLAEVMKKIKMVIAAQAAVGLVFLGFFFWAKTNPFAASLTALIIYATLQVIGLALNPGVYLNPIALLIVIVILLALANGVKSGLAFKKMQREAEGPDAEPGME